jgi:acylaminoacyl-peptidase
MSSSSFAAASTTTTMNSSKLNPMMTDAEAYHTYASAAVDLLSVAAFSGSSSSSNSSYQISRSVRDIDANRRRTFLYQQHHRVDDDVNNNNNGFPTEESAHVIWRTTSPSGKKMVVFRKQDNDNDDDMMMIELYDHHQGGLVRKMQWPGNNNKLHGKLLLDDTFGSPAPWDPSESFLVYTAEQIPLATSSFFTAATSNESNYKSRNDDEKKKKKNPGMQNVVGYAKQESFGEKLHGQYPLHGIFVLDFTNGRIVAALPKLSSDDDMVVGQPIFQGQHKIVYTSWQDDESPRRLGLIYCQQRPTALRRVDVTDIFRTQQQLRDNDDDEDDDDNKAASETDTISKVSTTQVLTNGYRLAWSPRALPDGRLAFLTNKVGFDTHMGCFALAVLEADDSIRIVVDTVHDPYTAAQRCRDRVAGLPFPGLFVASQLPGHIATANDHILLTTQWGSCSKVIRVNLSTGQIDLLQLAKTEHEMSSQTLLWSDPEHGCLVSSQAPNKPATLFRIPVDRLVSSDLGAMEDIVPMTFPPMAASCVGPAPRPSSLLPPETWFDFEIIETQVPTVVGVTDGASPDDPTPIQSILLMPKQVAQGPEKPPLIVIPHGGPHSVSSTIYQPSCAFLCAHGRYALLLVNYRGSTGFGTRFLETLPTRIGSLDVADVIAATASVLDRVDETRIAVCGGSHGGFLAAHLTGQFPDKFRAAALRNPVVDLPAMVSTTDIPDWCFVEGVNGKYHWDKYRPPTADEMLQLYNKSPIQYVDKVQTPTLVALGLKDSRVTPSQGKQWYYALRSNQVPAKMVVYDDDVHAIDAPASEADHWILIKQWFDEHLLSQHQRS